MTDHDALFRHGNKEHAAAVVDHEASLMLRGVENLFWAGEDDEPPDLGAALARMIKVANRLPEQEHYVAIPASHLIPLFASAIEYRDLRAAAARANLLPEKQ